MSLSSRTLWRRHGTFVVASAAALVIFWLALHSEGSDWYICETHADILYSALLRFHEFPFFSFAFNGGTYFLQDPQNNLYSPLTPLVLVAGPSVGLRLALALWGGFGCWAFIVLMRRRVDESAAQIGGLAWALGVGVLWRAAVGNDMFLWHLGLPFLLLLVEKLLAERTTSAAIGAGLGFGLFILGPTFHSLMYLVLPTLPLFVIFELVALRPRRTDVVRIGGLVALAALVSLVIASPKLASWAAFTMRRQTTPDDVIPLGAGLRALVDYTATAWTKVGTVAHFNTVDPWWGVEEVVIALPPLATVLALVGLAAGFRASRLARTTALAVTLVAVGLLLACTPWLWQLFRTLTHGNFRVAPRFLAVAGFGMALSSAIGAQVVLGRWPRLQRPFVAIVLLSQVACALWWTEAASRTANQTSNDAVQRRAIDPFARLAEERAQLRGLHSFTTMVGFERGARKILTGEAYADGFLVVGNDFNPRRWRGPMPQPIVDGIGAGSVEVGHTRIILRQVAPSALVRLRVIDPRFGLRVRTTPPSAPVEIMPTAEGLIVRNLGNAPVDRVEIAAKLPISALWFWLSATTVIGAAGWLFMRRRPRQSEATRSA